LKQLMQLNSQTKILGVCFGHQLVAHLTGGVVKRQTFVQGP
jgi:GMP synthase-like glutamine amidotransferase